MARNKLFSFIAAALLTVVTLTTFLILRNYGPENAIWRFHNAAFQGDIVEITRVTMQPPDAPAVIKLAQLVRYLRREGALPDVQEVQKSPSQVVVWIAYHLPDESYEIRWVVDLGPASTWVIDANETYESTEWRP